MSFPRPPWPKEEETLTIWGFHQSGVHKVHFTQIFGKINTKNQQKTGMIIPYKI